MKMREKEINIGDYLEARCFYGKVLLKGIIAEIDDTYRQAKLIPSDSWLARHIDGYWIDDYDILIKHIPCGCAAFSF